LVSTTISPSRQNSLSSSSDRNVQLKLQLCDPRNCGLFFSRKAIYFLSSCRWWLDRGTKKSPSENNNQQTSTNNNKHLKNILTWDIHTIIKQVHVYVHPMFIPTSSTDFSWQNDRASQRCRVCSSKWCAASHGDLHELVRGPVGRWWEDDEKTWEDDAIDIHRSW
jgi:hypothetical protein